MIDERLDEIEDEARTAHGAFDGSGYWMDRICNLVAEVRRLKRALALSEASRGIPVMVGRD